MQLGWYDLNSDRSFPFLAGTTGQDGSGNVTCLPEETIVDCGLIFGPMIGFRAEAHRVWLQTIERTASQLRFSFRTDCPSLVDSAISFYVPLPVTERYLTIWEDTQTVMEELSVSAGDCVETLDWNGFLVLGDVQPLLSKLPIGGLWEGPAQVVQLEPSCIQSLFGQYVTMIHIANEQRTRLFWAGCRPRCLSSQVRPIEVVGTCLTGNIYFEDGNNLQVSQKDSQNALVFRASPGVGSGYPCKEYKVYPEELEWLAGMELYAPCHRIVNHINGLYGPLISLKAGRGVTITEKPDEHRIIIEIHGQGLIGQENAEFYSVSGSDDCPPPPEPGPCDCGPSDETWSDYILLDEFGRPQI